MENHLPLDLIIQILCRLPAKSLFRFKLVSKQWASLIKDKTFIKLHLQQSKKTNSLVSIHCFDGKILLMDLKSKFTTEVIQPCNDFGRLRLMGTFNGLIGLIFFSGWDSQDLFWEEDIVLWNISTKEHLILPKVPNYSNNDNYGRCKMFGFGYDSNNDDYKVIKIFETLDLDNATIYSLRSKSWGKINRCTPFETFGKIGVYVSSAFHWLASDNKIMFILAYNINTETQQILQLPDPERFEFVPKKVGVLGEDLYVLNYRFWPDFVEIWVMKEYGVKESWTRLLTIHNGEVDLRENLYSYPCCFKNGDEEVLVVAEDYLVYYNLRNKSFRRVPNNPELGKALMYHQSLASISD